jgi:hypothetical protein
MPNEIRPCTLWGHTFDAIGASVLPSGRDMGVYTKDNRVIRFEFATREALEISYMEAITTIANALNAPVLATDAVLAGLPKDANLRTGNHSLERNDKGEWGYYDFNENWEDQADFWVFVPIDASDRIFYDRCSKTAEYLRQFTLEGVRKETKDV